MFAYPLTTTASVLLAAAALLLCLEAARRARWNARLGEHLGWALATALVALGHRMTIELPSGLTLHYLGSAFLALLLGYPRALLSMAMVFAAEAARADTWSHWGLRVLLSGALPIVAMWAIVTACLRWLPRNPFVFLLGCGLFGQFAAYSVQLWASALVYLALAPAVPPAFLEDVLPYALLLATGEAWLEGMIITLLVVYVPGSVRLFDEGFYLRKRSA
jgi:uncharacterized membrane protein